MFGPFKGFEAAAQGRDILVVPFGEVSVGQQEAAFQALLVEFKQFVLVGAFSGIDLADAVVVGKAVEVSYSSGRQVLELFAEQGLHVQVVPFVLFVLQTEENGVVGIQVVVNEVFAGFFRDMRHPELERAEIVLQVE